MHPHCMNHHYADHVQADGRTPMEEKQDRIQEPKKDNRPSTEQWYKTLLKIKAWAERHDMTFEDAQYGWLATFFYELKDEL